MLMEVFSNKIFRLKNLILRIQVYSKNSGDQIVIYHSLFLNIPVMHIN